MTPDRNERATSSNTCHYWRPKYEWSRRMNHWRWDSIEGCSWHKRHNSCDLSTCALRLPEILENKYKEAFKWRPFVSLSLLSVITVCTSQILTVLSSEAVQTWFESNDHATSEMPPAWPSSVVSSSYLRSSEAFHIFTVLSAADFHERDEVLLERWKNESTTKEAIMSIWNRTQHWFRNKFIDIEVFWNEDFEKTTTEFGCLLQSTTKSTNNIFHSTTNDNNLCSFVRSLQCLYIQILYSM
jgi:hypothetical protein